MLYLCVTCNNNTTGANLICTTLIVISLLNCHLNDFFCISVTSLELVCESRGKYVCVKRVSWLRNVATLYDAFMRLMWISVEKCISKTATRHTVMSDHSSTVRCVMYQCEHYLCRLSSLLSICSGTMCGSTFRDLEHEREEFVATVVSVLLAEARLLQLLRVKTEVRLF